MLSLRTAGLAFRTPGLGTRFMATAMIWLLARARGAGDAEALLKVGGSRLWRHT